MSIQDFLVFDAETESTNLRFSRPWQFAAVEYKAGRPIKQHEIWIDIPNLKVGDGAARVTGFTYDKWNSKKIPLDDACSQIKEILTGNKVLVGHNVLGFDIYQIRNLFLETGVDIGWNWINKIVDTHCLARAVHYQWTPPKDNYEFMLWQYKLLHKFERGVKSNLGHMAREYSLDFDYTKMHDALYDVGVNGQVFQKIAYDLNL